MRECNGCRVEEELFVALSWRDLAAAIAAPSQLGDRTEEETKIRVAKKADSEMMREEELWKVLQG